MYGNIFMNTTAKNKTSSWNLGSQFRRCQVVMKLLVHVKLEYIKKCCGGLLVQEKDGWLVEVSYK